MKFSDSYSNHILSLNYVMIAYFTWRKGSKYRNLGSETRKIHNKTVGEISTSYIIRWDFFLLICCVLNGISELSQSYVVLRILWNLIPG